MNSEKTIFVVDDNDVNLFTANEVLSEHYNVYTLNSVSAMFKLFESVKPDLILLDILMPETNGFDAMGMLRSDKRFSAIPVIFLTGKSDPAAESRGFELGAVGFVSKPFSRSILLNCIKEALDGIKTI
jgi:putative two-component system response regulator